MRTRAYPLALLSSALLAVGLSAQEPARGGSVIDEPQRGFKVRVPSGWTAQRHESGGYLLFSEGVKGFFMLGPHAETSIATLRTQAADGLNDGSVQLTLAGDVQNLGTRGVTADYQGVANGAAVRGRAAGLLSPHGGGLTIVGIAEIPAFTTAFTRTFDELVQSVSFKAVEARAITGEWDGALRGRKLRYMEAYTSSGGGGGYSIEIDIALCANGQFIYRNNSAISANVPGMSAGGTNRDANTGTWSIIGLAGEPVLRLSARDGSVRDYNLSMRNNLVHLNGRKHFRIDNDMCG